jgi:methyltransferase
MLPIVLLAIVFVPMAFESRRSRRHDRSLRAAGAIEPRGDVYAVMQVAYPVCFLVPIGEAFLRGRVMSPLVIVGGVVFALAKVLKYWAIATLGPRWTFRVLVPPASERTLSGPYRVLRHPNYVGVAGELAGIALMAQASVTGPLAVLFFTSLMLLRIRVEERALGIRRG